MNSSIAFAEPRDVHDLAECFFYHVMDLPGHGTVGEQWDLRTTVDDYLGRFDFSGKRVLDVGAASGFLTFEMEKRGADVVSFDLADGAEWNIVPRPGSDLDLQQVLLAKRDEVRRLTNAYWFAHRVLGSRARVYYGDAYDLPEALGPFDAVVLGAILLHLRDPFRALHSVSRLSRDALIISDLHFESQEPVMRFLPDRKAPKSSDTWWLIAEPCMKQMLDVLGFDVTSITRNRHLVVYREKRWVTFSTYIARRRPG